MRACACADLVEAGAEVAHAQSGRAVHVVGGERRLCAVNEAESLEREASDLLVSVHGDDRLAVQVTPRSEANRLPAAASGWPPFKNNPNPTHPTKRS